MRITCPKQKGGDQHQKFEYGGVVLSDEDKLTTINSYGELFQLNSTSGGMQFLEFSSTILKETGILRDNTCEV